MIVAVDISPLNICIPSFHIELIVDSVNEISLSENVFTYLFMKSLLIIFIAL